METDDGDSESDRRASGLLDALADAAASLPAARTLRARDVAPVVERRFWQHAHREELRDAFLADELAPDAALDRLGFAVGESVDRAGFFHEGSHLAVDEPGGTYDADGAFDLAADGGATPGDDVASLLNGHRGERIVVPGETYEISETVSVTDGMTLVFDGTTVETPDGENYCLFDCDGDGWHVGGDLAVEQAGSFPWLRVSGTGQFGDANGRLRFVGECPDEVIGVKRESHTRWFVTEGEAGDRIVLKNVDQHEAPPYDACSDVNFTWTEFPGTMTVVGCHLGNFHDNGFYYKAMRGRAEFYDTYFENMNVAALRYGCDEGGLLRRCLVVDSENDNPARTAGKTCEGINHSVVAFQDLNGVTGDLALDRVYYQKGPDPRGGEFLRTMLDHHGDPDHCTVTVRDCRWPAYPAFGSAADTEWVTVEDAGGNGADASAARRQPYPLGGGDPEGDGTARFGP